MKGGHCQRSTSTAMAVGPVGSSAPSAEAAAIKRAVDVAVKQLDAGGDDDAAHAGEGWTASAWLEKQDVPEIIARAMLCALPVGPRSDPRCELAFFRALGKVSSRAALRALLADSSLIDCLADGLWPKFINLAGKGAATATELHDKFVDSGVGFDLEYAGLKTFYGGLEAVVGAPNPKILLGMERDHCAMQDALLPFETPNYKMSTCSKVEWWFVTGPERGLAECRIEAYPCEAGETIVGAARPRRPLEPEEFKPALEEINGRLASQEAPKLIDEEFLSARMYTGPCFVKYNTTLRGLQSRPSSFFRKKFDALCAGNKYCTTLHVINSGIVKLSKLTVAAKVYRGVSGGRLPAHFRVANEYGVRGGIDPAFMSTTLDRAVAMAYASATGGPGIVFSIQQGMVDRGADIGWLSQYPHEKEILFAPLGGLEIQKLGVEGTVLVPEVRLSINLNNATIDQVIGRRRKLLKDMGDNMGVEVRSDLSGTGFEDVSVRMLDVILGADALAKPGEWYNDEEHFQQAVAEVIDAKRSALAHEKRLRWLCKRPAELTAHADAIVKLLGQQSALVREVAVSSLAQLNTADLSERAHAVVPCLRDSEEAVRQSTVETLGRVEPAVLAREAPSIMLHLEHATAEPYVRRACMQAMAKLSQHALSQHSGAIARKLSDKSSMVRCAVLRALGHLEQSALLPHAGVMVRMVEDPDADVRDAAVEALSKVAASLESDTVGVLGRIKHLDGGVRSSAIELIGRYEPAALKRSASIVVDCFDDHQSEVRTSALGVVSRLEPAALATHAPALAALLSDVDPSVRAAAIGAISKLERSVLIEMGPYLLRCFGDPEVKVRSAAVEALLSRLELPDLHEHVAIIVERIEDPDPGIRRSAGLWALTKCGPELIAKHSAGIASGLSDDIVSVRRAALDALATVAPNVLATHAADISKCLHDDILSVRRAAVYALAQLAPADLNANVPQLIASLNDPEWAVRAAVVEALALLDPADLEAVLPSVVHCLSDFFDGVRSVAVEVLTLVEPAVLSGHADAIASLLEHSKPYVRVSAIRALALLEPAAFAGHTGALVELTDDVDRGVRRAALLALTELGDTEVLSQHLHFFLRRLDDADDAIQEAAVALIEKVDPSGKLLQQRRGGRRASADGRRASLAGGAASAAAAAAAAATAASPVAPTPTRRPPKEAPRGE